MGQFRGHAGDSPRPHGPTGDHSALPGHDVRHGEVSNPPRREGARHFAMIDDERNFQKQLAERIGTQVHRSLDNLVHSFCVLIVARVLRRAVRDAVRKALAAQEERPRATGERARLSASADGGDESAVADAERQRWIRKPHKVPYAAADPEELLLSDGRERGHCRDHAHRHCDRDKSEGR